MYFKVENDNKLMTNKSNWTWFIKLTYMFFEVATIAGIVVGLYYVINLKIIPKVSQFGGWITLSIVLASICTFVFYRFIMCIINCVIVSKARKDGVGR